MHYGQYDFSKDGRSPTIVPKKQGVTIGQRAGLSEVSCVLHPMVLWQIISFFGII